MKRIILSSTSIPFGPKCPFKESTGVSYYDNFLNSADLHYMETHKNRTGKVVMMTPEEYYQECATKVFTTSSDKLKAQRLANDLVDKYAQDMKSGDKFPLPYINYPDHGQEGLHRMMAAGNVWGWDTQFPVLVVNSVNDQVEALNNIWRYWCDATYYAKQFRYTPSAWKQEMVEEVQYKLDEYTDDEYHVIIVDDREDSIDITIQEFEDIMNPTTLFQPEFSNEDEESDTYSLDDEDFDWDDDDIDAILNKLSKR